MSDGHGPQRRRDDRGRGHTAIPSASSSSSSPLAPGETAGAGPLDHTIRSDGSSTPMSSPNGRVLLRIGRRKVSPDAMTEPGQSSPTSTSSNRWDASRLPLVDRDSYFVAGEIAHGGIGRVLIGKDDRLGRTVALKELLEGGGAAEERFVREALVTARLQHPSIVPVYEAGRWPTGEPFYTMKLFSGRSLDEVIDKAKTLDQRLALLPHVLAVTEAMAYAHSERIIHRDLKPANVLIGAFGETVVIDWGLAKDLNESGGGPAAPEALSSAAPEAPADGPPSEGNSAASAPKASSAPPESSAKPRPRAITSRVPDEPGLTMAGAIMGTPSYMPPEQAAGKPVDPRADVYALGAILYHVLAGVPPHMGTSPFDILRKTLAGPPTPIERCQRGVPHDLVTIVNKAMARDPSDRYPSAQELAQDLRLFQTGQIVRSHKYSRLERLLRFVRRYRAAMTVACAALLVLTIGAAVSVRGILAARTRAEQERDRAEDKQAEAEGARRDAVERADELTLAQARHLVGLDPNKALALLLSLSPGFSRRGAARTIAADAKSRGIARVLRHAGSVNYVAMSPDGSTLATACDDKIVRLIGLQGGPTRELVGHTNEVYWVRFSEDGERLASWRKDETLRVWDRKTGASRVLMSPAWYAAATEDFSYFIVLSQARLLLVDGATGAARDLGPGEFFWSRYQFSRDKRYVAVATRRRLALWDIERGAERRFPDHKADYRALALSPDGEIIAAGDKSGAVLLWDTKTRTARTLEGHTQEINELAFSPDGKTLVSASDDRTLRFWDVATGSSRAVPGHDGNVRALVFSRDGRRVVSMGSDRTVRVWDVEGRESHVLLGFEDVIFQAWLSPDGDTLAAASSDHTARVWDLKSTGGRIIAVHDGPVGALSASPDGKLVVSASNDGVVRVTDLASARGGRGSATILHGRSSPPVEIRFSSDGERVALATQDGAIQVWPVIGGEPLVLQGHTGAVSRIAFLPDGQSIVSAGKDATVRRWNLATGEGRILYTHDGGVRALALSPGGKLLASGGQDGALRVWDFSEGRERERYGRTSELVEVAFAPDGRTIVTGGSDHTIRFWDVTTRESSSGYTEGAMDQIKFLPDGKTFIAKGDYNSYQWWEVASGERLRVYRAHTAPLKDVAVSPDGRRVASASADHTVRLVDLETGESRALTGHKGPVLKVMYGVEGRSVISGGQDGTVRFWPDEPPDEPDALRAWIEKALPEVIDLRPVSR